MRWGKITICIFTALLVLLCVLAAGQDSRLTAEPEIPLSFALSADGISERLDFWEDEEDNLYVFLPGYASLSSVTLQLQGGYPMLLNNRPVTDGMSCEGFRLEQAYPLLYVTDGGRAEKTLTFFRSGQLPALYIDVASGSMEYIHINKENKERGSLRLYDDTGALLHSGALESVKGRGNSSWTADKKPYSLMLEEAAELLGMDSAQSWILLADGHNPEHLRNRIVYGLAEDLNLPYTPDTRWVDLFLNGEYAGVYLLAERNEILPGRLEIPEQGSFLVSLELPQKLIDSKISCVMLSSGQALRVHQDSGTIQELQALWQSVANAILAEDGIDPDTGRHWQELIDLDSWARKYLVEEVFANNDGGALSQYFYRSGADPTGKIYAGPVWDYDFSMGGEGFWLRSHTDYYTVDREYKNGGAYMPWFYSLCRKAEFHQRVTELYETEFLPAVEEILLEKLDAYADTVRESSRANALRWGWREEDFDAEVSYIRGFLERRTAFLTSLWLEEQTYHTVIADPGRYGIAYFAVKDGQCLPDLSAYAHPDALGWYRTDTGEPFDVSQPVYADSRIAVRKAEHPLSKIQLLPMAACLALLGGLALWEILRQYHHRNRKKTMHKV